MENGSEKVSRILNDTKAYILIGEALGIEIDNDSQIFYDIEEHIVEKYQEMYDANQELKEEDEE